MERSTLEQYRDTFKLSPEALAQAYDLSSKDWHPVTHYRIARDLGGSAVRNVVFFGGAEHSHQPTDLLFLETLKAARYVADEVGVDNTSLYVEGVVRKPPKRPTYEETFIRLGELGLFEQLLREIGLADHNIKSPEPSKEIVHKFAEEYGKEAVLGYFVLRKIPQMLEMAGPRYAYPATWAHLLHHQYVRLFDFPDTRLDDRVPLILEEMWNREHPNLQIKSKCIATPELVAALRNETTLVSCAKVPEEERSRLEELTVVFNMRRHLEYEAAFSDDFDANKNIVLGSGGIHHIAFASWLDGQLEGVPHTVTRLRLEDMAKALGS